jgi:hypothetical protein
MKAKKPVKGKKKAKSKRKPIGQALKEQVMSKSVQKRLALQRPKATAGVSQSKRPLPSKAPKPLARSAPKEPTKAVDKGEAHMADREQERAREREQVQQQKSAEARHGEGEILKAKAADAATTSAPEEGADLTARITECLDTWGAKQNTMLVAALRVVTERDTGVTNLALKSIAVELGIASPEEVEEVKAAEATKGPDAGLKPEVAPKK